MNNSEIITEVNKIVELYFTFIIDTDFYMFQLPL